MQSHARLQCLKPSRAETPRPSDVCSLLRGQHFQLDLVTWDSEACNFGLRWSRWERLVFEGASVYYSL